MTTYMMDLIIIYAIRSKEYSTHVDFSENGVEDQQKPRYAVTRRVWATTIMMHERDNQTHRKYMVPARSQM